jgi:hypothetical protein
MSNTFENTNEKLMDQYDYILDEHSKYETLSKIFGSKIFGRLGRYFKKRFEAITSIKDRFMDENEDKIWDCVFN